MPRNIPVYTKLSSILCQDITDSFYEEIHTLCPVINKNMLYNFISCYKMKDMIDRVTYNSNTENSFPDYFFSTLAGLLANESPNLLELLNPSSDSIMYINDFDTFEHTFREKSNSSNEFIYSIEDLQITLNELKAVDFFKSATFTRIVKFVILSPELKALPEIPDLSQYEFSTMSKFEKHTLTNRIQNIYLETAIVRGTGKSLDVLKTDFTATNDEMTNIAKSIARPFFTSEIFKSLTTLNYTDRITEYNQSASESDILLAKHYKYSLNGLQNIGFFKSSAFINFNIDTLEPELLLIAGNYFYKSVYFNTLYRGVSSNYLSNIVPQVDATSPISLTNNDDIMRYLMGFQMLCHFAGTDEFNKFIRERDFGNKMPPDLVITLDMINPDTIFTYVGYVVDILRFI